jgi:hypothetical protein
MVKGFDLEGLEYEDFARVSHFATEKVWGEEDVRQRVKFLRWPKVGNEVSIVVSRVIETDDTNVTTKDGKSFSVALSGVDYAVYVEDTSKKFHEQVTRLNIPTWEVVGKLRRILNQRIENGKSMWGWTLTIKHVREGKQGEKRQDNYELVEED